MRRSQSSKTLAVVGILVAAFSVDVAVCSMHTGCAHPGGTPNGQAYPSFKDWNVDKKLFKAGKTIKYVCEDGYELKAADGNKRMAKNSLEIICMSPHGGAENTFDWVPQKPRCEVVYKDVNDCGSTTGNTCLKENPAWSQLEKHPAGEPCDPLDYGQVNCGALDPRRVTSTSASMSQGVGIQDPNAMVEVAATLNNAILEKELNEAADNQLKAEATSQGAAGNSTGTATSFKEKMQRVTDKIQAGGVIMKEPVLTTKGVSPASGYAKEDEQDDDDVLARLADLEAPQIDKVTGVLETVTAQIEGGIEAQP